MQHIHEPQLAALGTVSDRQVVAGNALQRVAALVVATALMVVATAVATGAPAHASTSQWAPSQTVTQGSNSSSTSPTMSCTTDRLFVTTRGAYGNYSRHLWSQVVYLDHQRSIWYWSRGHAYTSPATGSPAYWNHHSFHDGTQWVRVPKPDGSSAAYTYFGGTRFVLPKPHGHVSVYVLETITDQHGNTLSTQYRYVGAC